MLLKHLEKICCSLVSSNEPLIIITGYSHTFMFSLSQTMHLFKASLSLLANTSTFCMVPLKVKPHCQLPLLLVHWSYRERNTHAILYEYRDVCQELHGESTIELTGGTVFLRFHQKMSG